jgi:hypothetical protein
MVGLLMMVLLRTIPMSCAFTIGSSYSVSSQQLRLAKLSSQKEEEEQHPEKQPLVKFEENELENESSSIVVSQQNKKNMELMWCTKDYCKDVVRERSVGDHNQILLTGPATGQMAYAWSHRERRTGSSYNGTDDSSILLNKETTDTTAVLLLVKHGDDEIMKIAADAVRNLTSLDVEVLLDPSVAARIKHYHGVDGDRIHLFEAVVPTPGFGDNLRQHFSIEELERILDDDADVGPPWNVYRKNKRHHFHTSTHQRLCNSIPLIIIMFHFNIILSTGTILATVPQSTREHHYIVNHVS